MSPSRLSTSDSKYSRIVLSSITALGAVTIILLPLYHLFSNYQFVIPRESRSPSIGETGWADTNVSVASQGKLWTPRRYRKFPSKSRLFVGRRHRKLSSPKTTGPICSRWVVLTTIFEPTSVFYQLSRLAQWCIVVVGDRRTNDKIWKNVSQNYPEKVVYLSDTDQTDLSYQTVAEVPWNHFGRKNVGYIYAIHHGTQLIWDTDDDNELKDPSLLKSLASAATDTHRQHSRVDKKHQHWNPYPSFNSTSNCSIAGTVNVWPRGFPLDHIKDPSAISHGTLDLTKSVTVFQSLADHDPDVDAIYRLSKPLPVQFKSHANTPFILALPAGRVAPFNAQATLWTAPSFWGLLLPITVHGRVSDIWRSYMTQRLMHQVGQELSFSAPIVVQIRNAHSYLADLQSEVPLYTQSEQLVQWLYRWEISKNMSSLAEALEQLSIDLYEIGILEVSDIHLTHLWISDLLSIGYQFPVLEFSKTFKRSSSRGQISNNDNALKCRNMRVSY